MNPSFETLSGLLQDGVFTVRLNRGKVNAIDTTMICELIEAVELVENQTEIRALVLTGQPGCFTAGLDLKSLISLDEDGVEYFWRCFHRLMLKLIHLDKPVISAISGHSPAGGCVLAICSDFRIMVEGDYFIGLNELAVGIPVPALIYELMSVWVGRRHAYQNLMTSKLLTPAEAFNQGLVDELVSMDQLDSAIRNQLKTILRLPHRQWTMSKRNFRAHLEPVLIQSFEDVFSGALQNWWEPQTRLMLESVVANLGKR